MKLKIKLELKKIIDDIKKRNIKKQIANILTLSRLLSPFILIPLMYFNKLNLFFIMIIIFSLTDAFDGYFARKYNSISKFGAYLDCFVDKIFALSLLISIIIKINLSQINFHLVNINIILEICIGNINIFAFFKKLDPKSTIYGKVKTYFLFITLCLLYLSIIINLSNTFLFIFILITIILQIITLISYIYEINKNIKKNKKNKLS